MKPELTFAWSGNYWFVLPYISFGICTEDFNIAFGWLKAEIRFNWIR